MKSSAIGCRAVFFVAAAVFACTAAAEPPAWTSNSPYAPGPTGYPRFKAKMAEPNITYGAGDNYTLPKTLLFSTGLDELAADAETWSKNGIQGFFLTGLVGDWSGDIWAADGEPWTIGESDKTFEKTAETVALCRKLNCEVFPVVSFSHFFDWFDSTAWPKVEDNFRQFALFARETGCTGLAIDIEYIFPQYHFGWEGYKYDGYTREELAKKIHDRMVDVARVMYDTFPDMVLVVFPEQTLSLGNVVLGAWIEEAARKSAPGGIHVGTEYTYRRPNIRYMFGHAWLINTILEKTLTSDALKYFRKNGSIAAGLWPLGADPDDYHGVEPSPDEFRQAFAASLMMSRRYNWVYSHNLRPSMLGRDTTTYTDQARLEGLRKVLSAREIAANTYYSKLAAEIRELLMRDYEDDLELTIVPTFAAPREEVEVGLMPVPVYSDSPNAALREKLWQVGLNLYAGKTLNLREEFGTQTQWLLAGPFDNAENKGFDTAYGPETSIDRSAEYPGVGGAVGWTEYTADENRAGVDLTKVFQPSEAVCSYALAYIHCANACEAQLRLGANDGWKLWANGVLTAQYAEPGRMILDREIVKVKLPQGTTPVLLKVCNAKKDWGFIFRVTGSDGAPVEGVTMDTAP